MRILILGAAGFIGTNLIWKLAENPENEITLVDREMAFFQHIVHTSVNTLHLSFTIHTI